MKKLKNQTVFLQTFVMLFLVIPLSANVVIPISSSETSNAFDHLDLTYPTQVLVADSTLENHLNNALSIHDFADELPAPLPNITNLSSSSLSFSWPSISTASSYRIEYIDLGNGSSNSTTSTSSSASINNLNSSLYLFSFLSISGTDQSQINALVVDLSIPFIIVDTEILLPGPTEEDLSCNCTPHDSINSQDQTNIMTTAFIPWHTSTSTKKYRVNIDVSNSTATYTTSLLFIQADYNNEFTTFYLSSCDSTYSTTKPYKIGLSDIVETTLTTKGIHLYFPLDGLTSYSVQTSSCQDSSSTRNSNVVIDSNKTLQELKSVQCFPNPVITGEPLQLRFHLPQANTLSIYIYDALGNRIQTISEQEYLEAGNYEKQISTDALPNGHLYWILQTNYKLLNIPFLKME